MPELSLDIATLLAAYREGTLLPSQVIDEVLYRIEADANSHNAWIDTVPRERLLAYVADLEEYTPDELPLFGIPFAVKDNIDLAGLPTTAACPDYAYTPERSAFVVQRLIAAGAIPVGKTNLDQFATGLVGTRSPYGPGRNAFDKDYIAGGSSSGSAVAVALGQVSFALGTDTAGSGRVPAGFNNLVGLKPSRGLLSTGGVVPACRSLDCVSVFALTAADADAVLQSAAVFDPADAGARAQPIGASHAIPLEGVRFGVPQAQQLAFFGDAHYAALFRQAVERLAEAGGIPVTIDLAPFLEAARLLYEGPWVAERYAAIEDFIRTRPEALHPVTRAIIEPGREATAVAAFRAQYRLAELKRRADRLWQQVDCVLTPTAGTIYTIAEVEADPVALNSNLGYYTNFMNLLDYAAVAVPAGFTPAGLPFGVTLFAPAFGDRALLRLAGHLHRATGLPLGATNAEQPGGGPPVASPQSGDIPIVVCGAHMSGLPLNHQLRERGARLLRRTRTAPAYRLYALPGSVARPALVRVAAAGAAIEVEVWALPREQWGGFVDGIPAPLGIGKVELADGTRVSGFLGEGSAAVAGEDISRCGGWRAWLHPGVDGERLAP